MTAKFLRDFQGLVKNDCTLKAMHKWATDVRYVNKIDPYLWSVTHTLTSQLEMLEMSPKESLLR